jgi:hypothetical protein
MAKRILNLNECEHFLKITSYGRLATLNSSQPYITPVNYVYCNGKIYIHSKFDGQKIENITNNPKVCFEISEMVKLKYAEEPCKWSCDYWSVIIFGKASIIDDPDIKLEVINQLVIKYAEIFSFKPSRVATSDTFAIIEITIEKMTGKESKNS